MLERRWSFVFDGLPYATTGPATESLCRPRLRGLSNVSACNWCLGAVDYQVFARERR